VAMVGPACAEEHAVPLAQWSEPDLLLEVAGQSSGHLVVLLSVVPKYGGQCPALGDGVRAEIAGQRLILHGRGGGFYHQGDITICEPARFGGQLPTDTAHAVQVTLADDSAMLEATYSGLLSERRLALDGDPAAALRTGHMTSVQVGQTTDAVGTGMLSFIPAGRATNMPAFALTVGSGSTATASGSTVTFTMPPGVTAGAGNLRFVGTVFPAVTTCTGFASCEGTLGVDARTSATVQP
jgi:hypothetical protein